MGKQSTGADAFLSALSFVGDAPVFASRRQGESLFQPKRQRRPREYIVSALRRVYGIDELAAAMTV